MENIRAFNKRIAELISSGQTQEAAALMESRVALFWIEEYLIDIQANFFMSMIVYMNISKL